MAVTNPTKSPTELTPSRDQVFNKKAPVADFSFGEEVALVFDDMLDRSVPFYREIQRMISEMAADFAAEGTNIYDLGCSTGTTLLNLSAAVRQQVRFIGVDYSPEMLERCRAKLEAHGFNRDHELIC